MSRRVVLVLAEDYSRAARWAQSQGLRRDGWHYIDTHRQMLGLSGPAVRIVVIDGWRMPRSLEERAEIDDRLLILRMYGAEIERV